MERWSIRRGGQYGEVVNTERWSIRRGGQYGEVVNMERWSIQRGGHYGEVVNADTNLCLSYFLYRVRLYIFRLFISK